MFDVDDDVVQKLFPFASFGFVYTSRLICKVEEKIRRADREVSDGEEGMGEG